MWAGEITEEDSATCGSTLHEGVLPLRDSRVPAGTPSIPINRLDMEPQNMEDPKEKFMWQMKESYPAMASYLKWKDVSPFTSCTPVLTPIESRPVGQSSPDRARETRPARKAPAKVQRPIKHRLGPIPMFQGVYHTKAAEGRCPPKK